MKILITVGGTGGHIYPAQALAKKLRSVHRSVDLLFVGGGLSKNRYFDRKNFTYKEVGCGALSVRAPLRSILNCFLLLKGFVQSFNILRSFRPDVVVGFGSYHTFSTLLAARCIKIPIVLHEANAAPGKVNRFFSEKAAVTGIHFPGSAAYFKGHTVEVGMPLREEYSLGCSTKEQARKFFQLNPSKLTILIFGGSQGASAINHIVGEAAALLHVDYQNFQILHFTGNSAATRELQNFYDKEGIEAVVREFEKQMNLAWTAGDLVISRAGASSIAEQIEFEVPGILIPYPYASERHQDKNADFMVSEVRGAIKMQEKGLTGANLSKIILSLLDQDQKRLKEMSNTIKAYKKRVNPSDLCVVVYQVAERQKK